MIVNNNEFTDRRKDPSSQALVTLINSLMEQVKELRVEVAEFKRSSEYASSITEANVSNAMTKILNDSFPDGDADLHRRAHEAQIKIAEDKSKMFSVLRTEVVKWGLLGLAGWLAITIWHAFLQGPKV
jgi:hypothetical protein